MIGHRVLMSVLGVGLLAGGVALAALPSQARASGGEPAALAPQAASAATASVDRAVIRAEKIAAFKQLVEELGKVPKDCSLKGKRLQGKIQEVTSFPDFKVKKVTSFPDLKVQWVTSFPDRCGKWQKVTSFPDFKIQWVSSFPDFTIQEVSSFPGVP